MQCPHCNQELTQIGNFRICAEHGQIDGCLEDAQQSALKNPQNIFISYGRADALELAKRLADDLKKFGGHNVFFDMTSIDKGGLFEVIIERGIRSSSIFMAIMSAHAFREDSVCRDEVVFALNEGKIIVPLLKEPSPPLKPSLLLCRRNWIDFSSNYEEGLKALLRFLEGDETALQKPRLPVITGVVPIDFGLEIARYTTAFTGRRWVNCEIDKWLSTREERAFVIVAEPGAGKSSIAAWLSQVRQDDVVGIHFCTRQNTRSLDPYEFVASLIGQLQARIDGFADAVEARSPDAHRNTASDAFRELIIETGNSLSAPEKTKLIVVDSLDEALLREGETILDVLVQQVADLPSWLRVVTTSCPEATILSRIRKLNVFTMLTESRENRQDVRDYIHKRLEELPVKGQLSENNKGFARQIELLAYGNFLYARLVLDDLAKGDLKAEELGSLTSNLVDYYHKAFGRRFPDMEDYDRYYTKLLRTLAAARGPLSFDLLQKVCGESRETLNRRILQIRSYLRVYSSGETGSFAFFHKSLQDWITDHNAAGGYWLDVQDGHSSLSDILLADWAGDEYALRHLPSHLIASGRWEDLEKTLTDLQFIEARVSAGLAYELIEDYLNALRLSDDAWPGHRRVEEFSRFFKSQVHILKDSPELTFQQAINHPDTSGPCKAAMHLWESDIITGPWVKSINKSQQNNPIIMTIKGHEDEILYCAYSPDGKRIVSASSDKTLKIWDAATGQEISTLKGHDWEVTTCAYSPDGKSIVSTSSDKTLKIWDAETGEEISTLKGHDSGVNFCAYSPDGKRMVSASWDKTLKIWDAETGEEITTLKSHDAELSSCVYSPDGKRIVSASSDKSLKIWDAETWEEVYTLKGHDSVVASCAYSPDGKHIVSASSDKTLKIWDAETGQELSNLKGHDSIFGVNSCMYSPDGKRIASASSDKTLKIWDAETGQELSTLKGHDSVVNSCAYSPDGKHIISASRDKTMKIWDAEACEEVSTIKCHESGINSCEYSPDGKRIVTASRDKTLKIWDAETGQELSTLKGHDIVFGINSCAYSPDGKRIVSAAWDKTLKIWDAETGQEITTFKGHDSGVNFCMYSPDGKHIISASSDKTLKIWNAETGQEISTLKGHDSGVASCAYSPDGKRIISVALGNILKIWDVETGQETATFEGHDSVVASCAYSPDGKRIVSASWDKTLKIWDAETYEEITTLKGHDSAVNSCAYSPDGKYIVSASSDKTLKIWDAETSDELATFYASVTGIAINKFGDIAAGGASGELYILKLIEPEKEINL